MGIRTEIREITPTEAQALLEGNINNRNIRSHVVERYGRDMSLGRWVTNGESVKVALDGTLLDGQHRLMACVESDTPFTTIFITGLLGIAKDTIDTGTKRSFSDLLKWRGETSVAALGAAIESGLTWDQQGKPGNTGAVQHSNAERLQWLEENPDVREAVTLARHFSMSPFRFPVSANGPLTMRLNRISPEETEAFYELLKTGANLSENDPIARLRGWLIAVGSHHGTRPRWEYAAVAIKAWNAWVEGREIRQLTWKRGGLKPEAFPVIVGPDGRTYDEIILDTDHAAPSGIERMGFTRQDQAEGEPVSAAGA